MFGRHEITTSSLDPSIDRVGAGVVLSVRGCLRRGVSRSSS